MDLAAALDEIGYLNKKIDRQSKRISSLQSQLEKFKSKNEEDHDAKNDLEVALQEIGGLSDFIKKQEIELSSQSEKVKNK